MYTDFIHTHTHTYIYIRILTFATVLPVSGAWFQEDGRVPGWSMELPTLLGSPGTTGPEAALALGG